MLSVDKLLHLHFSYLMYLAYTFYSIRPCLRPNMDSLCQKRGADGHFMYLSCSITLKIALCHIHRRETAGVSSLTLIL